MRKSTVQTGTTSKGLNGQRVKHSGSQESITLRGGGRQKRLPKLRLVLTIRKVLQCNGGREIVNLKDRHLALFAG